MRICDLQIGTLYVPAVSCVAVGPAIDVFFLPLLFFPWFPFNGLSLYCCCLPYTALSSILLLVFPTFLASLLLLTSLLLLEHLLVKDSAVARDS